MFVDRKLIFFFRNAQRIDMKHAATRRTDADSPGSAWISGIFCWIACWKIVMRGAMKPDSGPMAIAGKGVEFLERNGRDRHNNSRIFRRDLPFF